MTTNEKQNDLIEKALGDCDVFSSDIPAIDLYVDQILSLLSEKIASGSEPYRDKLLTKTMINNYSKDGLLSPIKGKKYSKEQIIQMLLIYFLKGTLSMGEISRYFDELYKKEQFSASELVSFYDEFVADKENMRDLCRDTVNNIIDSKKPNAMETVNTKDTLSVIMSLLCVSAYLKTTATLLFDECCPESTSPENDKKKEKKK